MAASLRDLKVAVWANDDLAPVSRDVERGVQKVADALRRAGASVNADARPPFPQPTQPRTYQDLLFAYLSIAVPDPAFAELKAQTLNLAPDDQRPELAMLRAQTMDHRRWVQQNEAREKLRWAWRRFLRRYDVLVAPIMATAAFPHDQGPMGSRTIDVDGSPRPYFEQVFWAGLPGVRISAGHGRSPPATTRRACRSACRSSVPRTAIESPSALRGCSKPKASRSRRHPPTPEFTAEHHR